MGVHQTRLRDPNITTRYVCEGVSREDWPVGQWTEQGRLTLNKGGSHTLRWGPGWNRKLEERGNSLVFLSEPEHFSCCCSGSSDSKLFDLWNLGLPQWHFRGFQAFGLGLGLHHWPSRFWGLCLFGFDTLPSSLALHLAGSLHETFYLLWSCELNW